ncbi:MULTISPECIES: hypothetical protein [Micrococcaceae]|uniref:hypothetical protein n=1 Tax=Micrococcaceae TaxID=1268 RepID=UPI000BB73980|nr:hypothetical protein [Glutamicibacter sp. BW78]PCC26477.1 hypothetical protein CIK75_02960 [Glutamicibacter sp. BW78]
MNKLFTKLQIMLLVGFLGLQSRVRKVRDSERGQNSVDTLMWIVGIIVVVGIILAALNAWVGDKISLLN